MQRLYDRYDLLCDAYCNLKWASEALRQCRDVSHGERLAALEQISGELERERDATHLRLEQMESMEQAALARGAAAWRRQ